MAMTRGILEMLQLALYKPKSFTDFTKMRIGERHLSSVTVSKRLDELIITQNMTEVTARSKSGRRIIAYKTTDRGKQVIKLAKELDAAIACPKAD